MRFPLSCVGPVSPQTYGIAVVLVAINCFYSTSADPCDPNLGMTDEEVRVL